MLSMTLTALTAPVKSILSTVAAVISSSATIWDWINNANTILGFCGGVIAFVTGCMGFIYMRQAIENNRIEKQIKKEKLKKLQASNDSEEDEISG